MACVHRCSYQRLPALNRTPAGRQGASRPRAQLVVTNAAPKRCSPATAAPSRCDRQPSTHQLRSLILGAGLGLALALSPPTGLPVAFAEDAATCMKKCTKECNKIAPGSPGYCEETCADECSFMESGADAAGEAEGKQKVGNLGFLGEDLEGNSVDRALSSLFSWGRTGAANEPGSRR